MIRRKDLKPTHNLKATFKAIRNHLAGNTVGATRDELLAQQLINLIFCKIYDERFTEPDDIVTFRSGIEESSQEVKKRISELFEKVKRKYKEVLNESDNITLDANSVCYVVGELQYYCIVEAERDVVADAFETFIGKALKGGQGQFFTPRNVVKMMVDILDPGVEDVVIDPACGSGGFLIEALKNIWRKLDTEGEKYNWSKNNLHEEKMEVALYRISGIDKDYFLSKVAKAYMAIIGDGKSSIVCEDSLENPKNWNRSTKLKIDLGKFSVLLTNPPFGSKISVRGEEKLKQFDLGHKWKLIKKTGEWKPHGIKDKEEPQVLFIERCIQFLDKNGKMAIVLPEGIFGNPSDRYIWDVINKNASVVAVISCAEETFQPNTHFKTSVLVIEKNKNINEIFMAIAKYVGHNKNGKEIYKINNDGSFVLDRNGKKIINDELPEIVKNYKLFMKGELKSRNHLGFTVKTSDIKNNIYIPDYYDPELQQELESLKKSGQFNLFTIRDLQTEGIIKTKRGNEIGSQFYGMGEIPFIRTTDIVNWEIKADPVKSVPEEIYNLYSEKQDIKENDILFVKDGTFLIGRTAMVTEFDEKIIIQSHLIKIRVVKNDIITQYYLIYLLNLPITKKQIKNVTFVQGTISTVGDRFYEIVLPVHKNKEDVKRISDTVENIIKRKKKIKEDISALINSSDF